MAHSFYIRKYDGTNKNIKCIKCNSRLRINSSLICYLCFAVDSLTVNSGNKKIDDFIRGTQSLVNKAYELRNPFLEWVPFEEFKEIRQIGQGGFSRIYRATWKAHKRISSKGRFKQPKEIQIVLKVLNYSQNVDTKFLNEVIIIIIISCILLII